MEMFLVKVREERNTIAELFLNAFLWPDSHKHRPGLQQGFGHSAT